MTEMLDDRFDDQLRDSAREYNAPPETPREAMWARIVAERNAGTQKRGNDRKEKTFHGSIVPSFRPPYRRLLLWPAGIAAVLAIGIGLGRMSAPRSEPALTPVAATEPAARLTGVAYQVATTEHLGQAEAFLTLFRTSVRRSGNEQLASATARHLLATNRLLLDSPAASDTRTRVLLQDLELVLAQIGQLSPRPSSSDLDLITDDLKDSGVMSRLRTAVPSGTSATQGVL
jgi:hypothetical protein